MSEFHRVLLGLHAQARRIDRDQSLLGALGVGAFAYSHQLESVARMVSATTCRWLLADEVGLGKTIEAIMVMRALAAQSVKGLRVALVIPDDLVSQWEGELLCRGHALALESAEAGAGNNLTVSLFRASAFARGVKIDADKTDLLLVDEFPRLAVQVRSDISMAARGIPNVLIMTATPSLHVQAMRSEILAILEPDAHRLAVAEERDILDVLVEREQAALEKYGRELQNSQRRRVVEENFGIYRRLIRTQRSDYPNTLPQRVYQPVRLAATDGDLQRGRVAQRYLTASRTAEFEVRGDLLLQVAGRSPQSLRDRLSTLRRTTPELAAACREIDQILRDEPGDTRLDALIDHIRGIHAVNPNSRLVVVAEDNPTTDYLRSAIEKLADVRVANKRRTASPSEVLEVHLATLKDALDDFISGEAKVLVAADVAREGHNLQFADEIIFFALPWSPPAIQQWIGRIDRLGTKGMPSKRRVTITPLVVEGSIEARILDVLEETGVFLRSEIFDDSDWIETSEAISEAANGLAGASWSKATKRAKLLGDHHEDWLRVTRLPPSPRTKIALERQKSMMERPYAAPIRLSQPGATINWFQMREQAIEGILRLSKVDYFEIRRGHDGDQSFQTIWYRTKPADGDLIFSELDTRSSWHRQAFITRRSDISCPPYTNVLQTDNERRRLNFLDHGNGLHDCIVTVLERAAPLLRFGDEFLVDYPEGHPILKWRGRRVLFASAELAFGGSLTFSPDWVQARPDSKESKPEQDVRDQITRRALTDFQADRRWLISLCPPHFLLSMAVEEGNGVVRIDALEALFDPFFEGKVARRSLTRHSQMSEGRLKSARVQLYREIATLRGDCVQATIHALRRALEERLFSIEVEGEQMIAAATAELDVAMRLDAKFEFNRAKQRAARLAIDLAKVAWLDRSKRIREIESQMGNAELKNPKFLVVVPRPPDELN